jgi:hypothetical protein
MTTEYAERVAGDIGQYLDIQSGGIANLNGVTGVTGHAWRRNTHVALTASVIDADTGIVRIQLGGTGGWLPTVQVDSTRKDVWQLEYQTEWGDGSTLTFPTGRPLRLGVRRQGDPTP